MSDHEEQLLIYLNLAKDAKARLRISDHDRLMVLSAAAACEAGLRSVAEFCRHRVLQNNPGHKIGHYEGVNQALADDEFQYFLGQIRRRYAREHAEGELDQLEVDPRRELAKAGSLEAYLSQLLGVDFSWIDEHFEV